MGNFATAVGVSQIVNGDSPEVNNDHDTHGNATKNSKNHTNATSNNNDNNHRSSLPRGTTCLTLLVQRRFSSKLAKSVANSDGP